mmetsp:Transcript_9648/g.21960  ORF Transcript_9648/g.21960 Transcript_9648/m.21960 type:complete len:133 (+) Transcript_9648:46-444(+)
MVAPRLGNVVAAAARHARASMARSFAASTSSPLPVSRSAFSSAPRALESRSISTTSPLKGAAPGGQHHAADEPNGWLFGVKPGEKPEAEGWEYISYGVVGGFIVLMIAASYRPKTSIKVWAMDKIKEQNGDA